MSASAKRLRSGPILRRARWARATFAALVTVSLFRRRRSPGPRRPRPHPAAWKTIPGVRADFGQGIAALGWASGRVWMALTGAGVDKMSVTSARVAGRGLSGFETTRLDASGYVRMFAGSELVYSVSKRTRTRSWRGSCFPTVDSGRRPFL